MFVGLVAIANDRLLGNVRFLGFYLIGGIASTMTSLFWRRVKGDKATSSEGASGAIYSCMGMCIPCLLAGSVHRTDVE